MLELAKYQMEAIDKLNNGSILCGNVGTGKSRTALAYYFFKVCGGTAAHKGCSGGNTLYSCKKMKEPIQLFIITTAKKRDSGEWIKEYSKLNLSNVTVDSWNNIKKYTKIYGCFFIFDEQRVVGKGSWVKSFLKITNKNKWILLTATPGDSWQDYIPVFIANGFYRNRTHFNDFHVIFSPYTKYPKIERYVGQGLLMKYRNKILVKMDAVNDAIRLEFVKKLSYDKNLYRTVMRDRWDPYDNCPIEKIAKVCYMRLVAKEATEYYNHHTNQTAGGSYGHCGREGACQKVSLL